jgi:uncharacterized protein YegL
MPKIGQKNEDMATMNVANSNFKFSGVRPDKLESTEYTLVSIVVDKSGSVQGFRGDLVNTIKSVIDSCGKSPRAENLLVRVSFFNEQIEEIHGFLPLEDIDLSVYESLQPSGCTALFDATFESIGSVLRYSEDLQDQEMDVNGICVIITDGADNDSTSTPGMIKKQIEDALNQETIIESVMTILVGINAANASSYLNRFQTEANLQQFVDAGDADVKTLAKLAKFVSQSISSQSQSLGTGGPSQSLSF